MDDPPDADNDLIRQHWLDAIDATMEAHEMGFPDLVIGFIDEIEELLRGISLTQDNCCPDNVTYFDPDLPTDPGYDYDGETFPDPWGESETPSDADDWRELVCGAAHAYMDYLVGIGDTMDELVLGGAVGVAAIASILGLLSGAGLILAVSYGAIAAVVTSIIASATTALFGDASDDLETARDLIICAMLQFDGDILATAIEDTVSALAWTLFFSHIDYESAVRILQTGEFDSSYLPITRSTDCGPCLPPEEETAYWFNVAGGVCIDMLDGDQNLHNEDIVLHRVYKAVGNHGSVELYDLDFYEGVGDRVGLTVNVFSAQKRSGCATDPVLVFMDVDLVGISDVDNADIDTFVGSEDDVGRFRMYCTKHPTYDPPGHVEFWLSEP